MILNSKNDFIINDFVSFLESKITSEDNKKIFGDLITIINTGDKFVYHPNFDYYALNFESYLEKDYFIKNFSNIPKMGTIELLNPYTKNKSIIVFIHYSHYLFKNISIKMSLYSKLKEKNGFLVFYFEKTQNGWILPKTQLSIEEGKEIFSVDLFKGKSTIINNNIHIKSVYSIFRIFKAMSYFFNTSDEYFFIKKENIEYKINTLFFRKINQNLVNHEIKQEIIKKYKMLDENLKQTYNTNILK